MNFNDLRAIQDDLHRANIRSQELEAENAALRTLILHIDSAALLAERGLIYRFPVWVRAAIEKVMARQ